MESCYLFFWNSKAFLFSVKKTILSQGTKLFWPGDGVASIIISIILEVTEVKPVRVDRSPLRLGLGTQNPRESVGKFWKCVPIVFPKVPFLSLASWMQTNRKWECHAILARYYFNVFHFPTSQRIYSEYFQWDSLLLPSEYEEIVTRKLGFCTI